MIWKKFARRTNDGQRRATLRGAVNKHCRLPESTSYKKLIPLITGRKWKIRLIRGCPRDDRPSLESARNDVMFIYYSDAVPRRRRVSGWAPRLTAALRRALATSCNLYLLIIQTIPQNSSFNGNSCRWISSEGRISIVGRSLSCICNCAINCQLFVGRLPRRYRRNSVRNL